MKLVAFNVAAYNDGPGNRARITAAPSVESVPIEECASGTVTDPVYEQLALAECVHDENANTHAYVDMESPALGLERTNTYGDVLSGIHA